MISNAQSAVQFVMGIGCLLMGLSHILQPGLWITYFAALREQGRVGLMTRTMLFEFWPALMIISLHQVWHGPAIILSAFGWLLLAKCTVSLLAPQLALRSLGMAHNSPRSFQAAGVGLLVIAAASAWALLWP